MADAATLKTLDVISLPVKIFMAWSAQLCLRVLVETLMGKYHLANSGLTAFVRDMGGRDMEL